jgi:hypothetical protein
MNVWRLRIDILQKTLACVFARPLPWQSFDPSWLVELAREQHPDDKALHAALAECRQAQVQPAYIRFVSGARPNQRGSAWQFGRNVALLDPLYGEVILEVLKDGRIGGAELWERMVTPDLAPDVEGEFHLFGNGRAGPAYTGYRPLHEVHANYLTSGEHTYVGTDRVCLGGTVKVQVRLISPHAYPCCLWVGREIRVFEGSKQVGVLRVTQVMNPVLRTAPDAYQPEWRER